MGEGLYKKNISVKSVVEVAWIPLLILVMFLYWGWNKYMVDPFGMSLGVEAVKSPDYKKGKAWNGEYLWYGNIRWRILSKIDILLFADRIPEDYYEEWRGMSYTEEDPEEDFPDHDWHASPIRAYLNSDFYARAFTPQERDGISYTYEYGAWDPPEDKLFLLYWRDIGLEKYGFSEDAPQLRYEEDWWLCQLGGDVYVTKDGEVVELEEKTEVYDEKAIRPAFYVGRDRIVYLKDVGMELPEEVSPELTEARKEGDLSGEWVPALSSAAQHVTIDDVRLEGDVCTMSYRDAACGEGQYLSAIVTDAERHIRYYGRLKEVGSEGEGTLTVRLPKGYRRSWELLVFSEDPREGTVTSYASDPVVVLDGKEPAEEELVSVGVCDPDHKVEPLDMIINRYYDPCLDWTAEDYEAAEDAEKHRAATAAMLYTMLSREDNGLLMEGRMTAGEIADGARYAEEHAEDVRMLADTCFAQAKLEGMTLKELMDRNYSMEYGEAYEGEVDLYAYTEYLDYTGAMFLEAEPYEQENVLIACVLYLQKYRMGAEVSEEQAEELAYAIHHPEYLEEGMKTSLEAMRGVIELSPEEKIRDIMNFNTQYVQQ